MGPPHFHRRFAFNGRFLTAAETGVQRVAGNLIRALDDLPPLPADDEPELAVLRPRHSPRSLNLGRLPEISVGTTGGQVWEQVELPLHLGSRRLINLCNSGPLLAPTAITMIHDAQVFISPGSYSPAFARWYRFMQPRLARQSERVLTVSEYSKALLVEHRICGPDKISVIPNGADHILRVEPDPSIISIRNLTEYEYVFMFGSFQVHKNLELIVRLFYTDEFKNIDLVLSGNISWDEITSRFGLHPIPNIHLIGPAPDSQIRALMEKAACLACPSETEGFGLPPLEAMILGCPAVVAPRGALPEVCGDAATYADPGRIDDWAHALLRRAKAGYDPGDRERVRRHAEQFTWKRAASQLRSIIGDLTGQPSRKAIRTMQETHIGRP